MGMNMNIADLCNELQALEDKYTTMNTLRHPHYSMMDETSLLQHTGQECLDEVKVWILTSLQHQRHTCWQQVRYYKGYTNL